MSGKDGRVGTQCEGDVARRQKMQKEEKKEAIREKGFNERERESER